MVDFAPGEGPAPCRLAEEVRGSGTDLVLIHGGAGSRNHWQRNIGPLASHFRVHALDLPGYGESPDTPARLDAEGYIDLLHEALASLKLAAPFSMIGFSFGGAVAAALAVKLEQKLDRLCLIGPAGFAKPPGTRIEIRNLRQRYASGEDYHAAVRHNLAQMMLWQPASDEAVALHHENVLRTRFDSRIISQRASMLADLAKLSCPTLILYGEHDCLALPSVAARMAACRQAMPQAQCAIIPAAGHWAQYENAAAVNQALLGFLRG